MSLNQKYTWKDFLVDHPDFAKNGTKRTSSDGKKAFESAYKAFLKKYFADRTDSLTKEIAKASKRRDEFITKLKAVSKSGKKIRIRNAQKKVGRTDKSIVGFKKQQAKIKVKQKGL